MFHGQTPLSTGLHPSQDQDLEPSEPSFNSCQSESYVDNQFMQLIDCIHPKQKPGRAPEPRFRYLDLFLVQLTWFKHIFIYQLKRYKKL